MNAETRAKAFVQSYGCGRGADYPCTTQEYCPCFDDVVHAFRQAENDKLEEAADAATKFLVGDPFNGVPLRSPGPHEIAAHIRSLKLKD